MQKYNLIGPFFGTSGYVSHAKGLANALHNAGAEVRVDSIKPPGWETQVNDAELLMLNRPFDRSYTSVLIGQPQWLPFVFSEKPAKVVCFVIWEGDAIPEFWYDYLVDPRLNEIWVPSVHTKLAIENTFNLEVPIKVVPHGVDLSLFMPQPKPDATFTFVACKGWSQGKNDRGGIQFVLRAFCEEFSKEEGVQLNIKLNPAYFSPGWDLQAELDKLDLPKDHAPINFLADTLDYKDVPSVFAGDVFVNSSMSEAFGLPVLEAMACGLPIINTDYPGQDLVNDKNGWLVQSNKKEVDWDIAYEGVSWWEPDIKDLRGKMRYVFEHLEECKVKGKESLSRAKNFTWANTAKLILS